MINENFILVFQLHSNIPRLSTSNLDHLMFDLNKIIGLRLALKDLFTTQEEEEYLHVQADIY